MADVEAPAASSSGSNNTSSLPGVMHHRAPNSFTRLLRKFRGQPFRGDNSSSPLPLSVTSSEGGEAAIELSKGGARISQDPEDVLGKFIVPIDSYEGRHRFDPRAEWSEKEEKALVRRVWQLLFVHRIEKD